MLLSSWLRFLTADATTRARRSRRTRTPHIAAEVQQLEIRTLLTTYVVDSTADSVDSGDGVTTLREAILAANATGGLDVIEFHVGGGGVQTIQPLSSMPTITDAVIIDGSTQPGFSGSPLIELDGSLSGTANGLWISADGSTVKGLAVNRFSHYGIVINEGSGNRVEGNYIGTDPTGAVALPNGSSGVFIHGSNNTIGGTTAGSGNVISGNGFHGVWIVSGDGNVIQGNLIGTDSQGQEGLGNGLDGINILNVAGTLIGGTIPGARNVISDNRHGVNFAEASSPGNRVQGNLIGTKVNGTSGLGNHGDGIRLFNSSQVLIGTDGDGTDDSAERNIISGNASVGVRITDGSTDNTVAGNHIGTDIGGSTSIGNEHGILIVDSSSNLVGTDIDGLADEAERNLISGNRFDGVRILGASSDNVIAGNYIGTTASGTNPLPNPSRGIRIDGGSDNMVGGTASGAGNVISANGTGIWIITGSGNAIQGNLIGTNAQGDAALGNSSSGILIQSSGNIIGGSTAGAGNVISGNRVGIDVLQSAGTGNQILGNRIGTDSSGTNSLGNQFEGIKLTDSSSIVVGGVTPGSGNLIAGNHGIGVLLIGAMTTSNAVIGNLIGTDLSGTNGLPNSEGVRAAGGASSNQIGGTLPGERNVISGNVFNGVTLSGGTSNSVLGNFIGTDILGEAALPNESSGVLLIDGPHSNIIGGTAPGAGNVISGNGIHGITVVDGYDNIIQGNFIGTDVNGEQPLGNEFDGINIRLNAQAIVGGTAPGAGNVISDNRIGINFTIATNAANQVLGNRIGTNRSGTAAVGTQGIGVFLDRSTSLVIGGADPGAANFISGNQTSGVLIQGASATSNHIIGNLIGTNITGDGAVPNGTGVQIDNGASANRVGGHSAGERNVISGNSQIGVRISGTGTDENIVAGNYVGTEVTGESALANQQQGVRLDNAAQANRVIGNVISGNGQAGVQLRDAGTSQNVVQSNFVGTNASGSDAVPNETDGVVLAASASLNIIGSDADGIDDGTERNVISGNLMSGIRLSGAGTVGNVVNGNRIGTDVSGVDPLPNLEFGVLIGGASTNAIGGTPETANVIAFNSGSGVVVRGNGFGNSLRGNSIHSNGSLGIDLGDDGLTLNDPGDIDSGPNSLQNYPVLSQLVAGNTTRVVGSLNSKPNTTFTIDLYANRSADTSGYGEGEVYLGSFDVTTDGVGNATFDETLLATTGGGQFITATATDSAGNTSEFSLALETIQELLGTQDDDTFLIETGASAGEILVTRTNQQGIEVFHFASSKVFLFGLGGNDTFIVNGLPTGELHLDGGDQDEVFEINASSGGRATILGRNGDDDVTINATSAAGTTVDLGEGDDDYTVNFGQVYGDVSIIDSGSGGTDELDVNGTGRPDRLEKTSGSITHHFTDDPGSVESALTFDGIEKVTIRGAEDNDLIIDPGTDTTLLGGPGDDTIIVNGTFGEGVIVDGEEGADTIIVELGSLAGPVSISDSGTSGVTTIHIVGTDADDHMTLSATGLIAGDEVVHIDFGSGNTTLILDGGLGDDLVTIEGELPFGVTKQLQSIAQIVQIDAKADSDDNTVNLLSNGVLPLVIFTTPDFDASTVAVRTVAFAGAAAVHNALEDVDGDGDLDLILHFRIQEMIDLDTAYRAALEADLADNGILDDNHQLVLLTLIGQTTEGTWIEGADTINAFLAGRALKDVLESP